jgi:hypothetical protein
VRRQLRWGAVAAIVVVGVGGFARPAAGAGGLGGPRPLAVSVPGEPVLAKPGAPLHTFIRVLNAGRRPVLVRITSQQLILGNNGKVTVSSRPGPSWERRVGWPAGELRVPAQGYRDVPLTVPVPRHLAPDLYFIGFLVTPVATQAGSLKVINQIGSFVTIDVPGRRLRKLDGVLGVPGFVLGSQASGTLQVTNVGHAAVDFWGETDTNASPGGKLQQTRLHTYLLPEGRTRTLTVSGKPAWPIGFVTLTSHIVYPGRTEATTKELTFSKRVLVISPWVFVAAGVLILAAGLGIARARRRRKPDPSPAASTA